MSPDPKASLSEADKEQITTRNIYRDKLQTIHDTICKAEAHQLEPRVLEKVGILRQQLALGEKSKDRPFFFDPFQEKLEDLTEPDDPLRTRYITGVEMHDNVRGIHHFMEMYINNHEPVGAPGCSTASELDRWRRLSAPWGNQSHLRPHLTAPVMISSTMGPWHLRVMEAYFDGSKLVVRNTPLYDMRDYREDEPFLHDLCRWWYGHGIGNTKVLHTDDNLA
ncbi:hypothetical protein N7492_000972 [Penicillium capsulatum]|uniref:Uncharacterized protein n=1 Tax=Penicillium capsulatum TaxID=69766 RepID=A0A9W9LZ09_9EURO|nr:hypothetical protein N7492_000972 [Penicillium capsulatum]KAJ6129969.1 hypothetical protein N7512_002749 [Penicillium capsulatum]